MAEAKRVVAVLAYRMVDFCWAFTEDVRAENVVFVILACLKACVDVAEDVVKSLSGEGL